VAFCFLYFQIFFASSITQKKGHVVLCFLSVFFFTSSACAWTFVCGFLCSSIFIFLHMVLALEGSLVAL